MTNHDESTSVKIKKIRELGKALNLKAFANFEEYVDCGKSFEDNCLSLLERQFEFKQEASLNKRIKAANFGVEKTFNTFEITTATTTRFPNVNPNDISKLRQCAFLENNEDVVLVAPPGRGKTHLAKAIGYEAVKMGFSVLYKTAEELVGEMHEARTEMQLTKYVSKLNKIRLLIIDELGYFSYDTDKASLLFRVIAGRYERCSTIIATNYDFDQWSEFIKDKQLVHAIVDRLIHHSVLLDMNSPRSYRLMEATNKNISLNATS
jgi:DNA replication protein DnaC